MVHTGPGDDGIRVLYVEDDAPLRELVSTQLERADDGLTVTTAADAASGLDRIREGCGSDGEGGDGDGDAEDGGGTDGNGDDEGGRDGNAEDGVGTDRIDCVVSDYDLPDRDGLALLADVQDLAPNLPVFLYTAKGSEEVAAEAIRAGVTGYLRKGTGPAQYALLANRIRQGVGRARAERRLRRRATALDTAREGICILDGNGRVEYANDAYLDLYGYEREALLGESWQSLHPDDEVDVVETRVLDEVDDEGGWTGESVGLRADGSTFPEWKSIAPLADDGLVIVVADSRRLADVGE